MTWVVGNRWDALDGVQPDPLPLVSVIVAHYDQPAQLARTLQALAVQDYPPDLLEVIVADDGSPGPVRVPDGVRLVRQDDEGFRLAAVRVETAGGQSSAIEIAFLTKRDAEALRAEILPRAPWGAARTLRLLLRF